MAWAFVVYFFLPNSPLEPGRFFNEEERRVLARRFEENPFGKDRQPFKLSQFVEAVLDYRTWVYMFMGAAIYVSDNLPARADRQLCNGSVTAFGARIISGFGYDPLATTALLIPGGAMTCVTASHSVCFAAKAYGADLHIFLLCRPVQEQQDDHPPSLLPTGHPRCHCHLEGTMASYGRSLDRILLCRCKSPGR